mmetsp:Transcript_224/g.558  ORF Transcript_224/g.558 Transcript_224/m.558 type:complete len:89 (-) Transcript_224:537-803(-)
MAEKGAKRKKKKQTLQTETPPWEFQEERRKIRKSVTEVNKFEENKNQLGYDYDHEIKDAHLFLFFPLLFLRCLSFSDTYRGGKRPRGR